MAGIGQRLAVLRHALPSAMCVLAVVALVSWGLGIRQQSSAAEPPARPAAPAAGKVDLTFSTLGAQPGERLPSLVLSTPEGEDQPLSERVEERAVDTARHRAR